MQNRFTIYPAQRTTLCFPEGLLWIIFLHLKRLRDICIQNLLTFIFVCRKVQVEKGPFSVSDTVIMTYVSKYDKAICCKMKALKGNVKVLLWQTVSDSDLVYTASDATRPLQRTPRLLPALPLLYLRHIHYFTHLDILRTNNKAMRPCSLPQTVCWMLYWRTWMTVLPRSTDTRRLPSWSWNARSSTCTVAAAPDQWEKGWWAEPAAPPL